MPEEIEINFELAEKLNYKGLNKTQENKLLNTEWDFVKLINYLKERKEVSFNYTDFISTSEKLGVSIGGSGMARPYMAEIPYNVYDERTKQNRNLKIGAEISTFVGEIDTREKYIFRISLDKKENIYKYFLFINFSNKELAGKIAIKLYASQYYDFVTLLDLLHHENNSAIKELIYKTFSKAFEEANSLGKPKNQLTFLYNQAPSYILEKRRNNDPNRVLSDLKILLLGRVGDIISNEENAVLNILKSFINSEQETTYEETDNEYGASNYLLKSLINQRLNSVSLFEVLYKKMNNWGGNDNFTLAMQILYLHWINSEFSNSNNKIYNKYDGAEYIPYKNNKILIFNKNNYDFSFKNNEILAIHFEDYDVQVANLPSPYYGSKNANRSPAFVTKKREVSVDRYHIFQPITLINLEEEEQLKAPKNLIPIFFIKAIDDKKYWTNIEKAIWLSIDIITTFTGIGNFLKFRHLAKVPGFLAKARIVIGGIEFVNGVGGIILSLVEKCENEEFCNKLRTYLMYVDLLTLGVDVLVSKAIKKAAKEAADSMPLQLREAEPGVFTHLDEIADTADSLTISERRDIIDDVINRKSKLDKFPDGSPRKRGDYTRYGNWGEMVVDDYFLTKLKILGKPNGTFKRINLRTVNTLDDKIEKGIDCVYEFSSPPPKYVICDAKYGSSKLNMTKSGKQMSLSWIEDRLAKTVNKEHYRDILVNGYSSVLAKVNKDGQVSTILLNDQAKKISNWY